MEPLSWAAIANLVIKYGVPFVDKLITNSQNNVPVTIEEWDAAKKCIPFDVLVPLRAPVPPA